MDYNYDSSPCLEEEDGEDEEDTNVDEKEVKRRIAEDKVEITVAGVAHPASIER